MIRFLPSATFSEWRISWTWPLDSRRTYGSNGCRFSHSRIVSMFMETIVHAAALVSNYVPKPGCKYRLEHGGPARPRSRWSHPTTLQAVHFVSLMHPTFTSQTRAGGGRAVLAGGRRSSCASG